MVTQTYNTTQAGDDFCLTQGKAGNLAPSFSPPGKQSKWFWQQQCPQLSHPIQLSEQGLGVVFLWSCLGKGGASRVASKVVMWLSLIFFGFQGLGLGHSQGASKHQRVYLWPLPSYRDPLTSFNSLTPKKPISIKSRHWKFQATVSIFSSHHVCHGREKQGEGWGIGPVVLAPSRWCWVAFILSEPFPCSSRTYLDTCTELRRWNNYTGCVQLQSSVKPSRSLIPAWWITSISGDELKSSPRQPEPWP